MSYTHLSLAERHYIDIEHKKGVSRSKITRSLNRSHSTIIRELSRNRSRHGYVYPDAHAKALARHRTKPKAMKLTEKVKRYITLYIEQDWSPEQVAGRLRRTVLKPNSLKVRIKVVTTLFSIVPHAKGGDDESLCVIYLTGSATSAGI